MTGVSLIVVGEVSCGGTIKETFFIALEVALVVGVGVVAAVVVVELALVVVVVVVVVVLAVVILIESIIPLPSLL